MEVEIIKKKQEYDYSAIGKINRKLKVAAYARVSTDSEDQQTSFTSQQKYYREKITVNPNWIFVGIYADEGISGTQTLKRENFLKMIQDAMDGKIDYIETKSISRFARNTLDTLKYVRMLKNNGVGIRFEEEGIDTMDMSGELLLTVLSSVAQQEVENISSHVKLGLRMKKERGELVGFTSCYGYVYNNDTKTMIINEKEAEIVKLIYKTYLEGKGSTLIARMLEDMHIKSPRGGDKWQTCTVNSILQNEKYKGDVLQGKTYTADAITHKRMVNNGEEDKYYIKNHHEAIIDPNDFELAQDIRRERLGMSVRKKPSTVSVFSCKMRCGFCGKSVTKRARKDRAYWSCVTSISGNRKLCPNSKTIPEKVLQNIFMECFYLLTKDNFSVLDEFLNGVLKALKDENNINLESKLKTQRSNCKAKLNKLIDLYVDGSIDKITFEKKQENLTEKLNGINSQIESLENINESEDEVKKNYEKIKKEMTARESSNELKEFDESLFRNLVDYVIVGSVDESGTPNGYIIRFIIKNGLYSKPKKIATDEAIITNGLDNESSNMYSVLLDFISTQKFITFETEENGIGRNRKVIDRVRVRAEIEI
ncbi:MAG: recombinase family protein [bacterium]|nr:recombinase family protein [bacterium]